MIVDEVVDHKRQQRGKKGRDLWRGGGKERKKASGRTVMKVARDELNLEAGKSVVAVVE